MACGRGYPDAIDCAGDCWCKALDGRREPSGQWRADCPVPRCGAKRALEWDAPGKHVRWRTFCGEHDKEATRPHLAKLVGPCLPGRVYREPVRHEDLIALALCSVPPMSLRLALLELAGISTAEALDLLGVRRENRSRVIAGRTGGASKRMQRRRSD